jgi:hypothetical protein
MNIGRWLLVVGTLVISTGALLWIVWGISDRQDASSAITPLVVGGAVVLVAVMALVAVVYNFVGLSDQKQAMGLPDGSIRSVLALLILVIFAILAVFLYDGLSSAGSTTTERGLTETELMTFIAQHPNAPNLTITVASTKPATATNAAATNAPTNAAGAAAAGPASPPRYDVTYGGANTAATDFAKQLMAAIEALLTTVIGFYFGAKTANTAAAQAATTAQQATTSAAGAVQAAVAAAQQITAPAPTLSSVEPAGITQTSGEVAITIHGANLNSIVIARLERNGSAPVALHGVASNQTQVTGTLAVTDAIRGGGRWDVVVTDAAGNPTALKGALTIA